LGSVNELRNLVPEIHKGITGAESVQNSFIRILTPTTDGISD